MKRADAIKKLRTFASALKERGATSLYLFGSTARNQASSTSDLDLFLDYANNVKLYPKCQEYFRSAKPPLLAVWGKFDPYFIPAGAEAFKKDIPAAVVKFLPTGHFALETHAAEIGTAIREFLPC